MHMLLLHFHLQLVVPVSIPGLDQLRGTGAGSKRSEQNALPWSRARNRLVCPGSTSRRGASSIWELGGKSWEAKNDFAKKRWKRRLLPKVVMSDFYILVGKACYEMKQVETLKQAIQYPKTIWEHIRTSTTQRLNAYGLKSRTWNDADPLVLHQVQALPCERGFV